MKASRLETQDGTPIYVNSEFVMLLTPMFSTGGKDGPVALVVGQTVLHIAGMKIVVLGGIDEIAAKLWPDQIQRVDLAK